MKPADPMSNGQCELCIVLLMKKTESDCYLYSQGSGMLNHEDDFHKIRYVGVVLGVSVLHSTWTIHQSINKSINQSIPLPQTNAHTGSTFLILESKIDNAILLNAYYSISCKFLTIYALL